MLTTKKSCMVFYFNACMWPCCYSFCAPLLLWFKQWYFCSVAVSDILLSQTCAKILVGDPHQQIYAFRGARNALQKVTSTRTFYLTQVSCLYFYGCTSEKNASRTLSIREVSWCYLNLVERNQFAEGDSACTRKWRCFLGCSTIAEFSSWNCRFSFVGVKSG